MQQGWNDWVNILPWLDQTPNPDEATHREPRIKKKQKTAHTI